MKNNKHKTNYSIWYKIFVIYIFIFTSITFIIINKYTSSVITISALLNILLFWFIVKLCDLYLIAGCFYTLVYLLYHRKIESNLNFMLYLNLSLVLIQSLIYIILYKLIRRQGIKRSKGFK